MSVKGEIKEGAGFVKEEIRAARGQRKTHSRRRQADRPAVRMAA
ncbi:hypothetical protein [Bradyrhizobium canariense]|nr:hypothetical protein [Bradyrhizobium canariense]